MESDDSRSTLSVGQALGLGILTTVLATYALSFPLNHDAAWWAYVAHAMLGGEQLYRTLIEINPPLPAYVAMLPVVVDSATGLGVEIVFEGSVVLIGLTAVTVAWSLVRRRHDVGLGFPHVLVVGLLIAFFGAAGVDFGQREHLMVILTTPYVLLLWNRLGGLRPRRALSFVVGGMAALGFCLKPHFALLWLVLEAFYALRKPPAAPHVLRRLEAVAVMMLGLVYVAFVAIHYPQYFALLRTAGGLYARFEHQPLTVLLASRYLIALGLGTLVLWGRAGPEAQLARLYLVYSWAAFAVLILQGKGWSYHEFPVLAGELVMMLVFAHDVLRASPDRTLSDLRLRVQAVGLSVAVLMLLYVSVDVAQLSRAWQERALASRSPFFESIPQGESVLMLTDLFEDAYPLITLTGTTSASPFPCLWWIRALYAGPLPEKTEFMMEPIERKFARTLSDEFRRRAPAYVLVDEGRGLLAGRPFPYVEYLSRVPGFAQEWKHYEPYGKLDRLAVWRRAP